MTKKTRLNQIIAVVKGKKTECQRDLTKVHRKTESKDIFNGLSKTYTALDDEGEVYPDENLAVRYTVKEALSECQELLTDLFDVVATQDYANCDAKADIVVDGNVLLSDVPVTYLLFLQQQLNNIHKYVLTLPTLDQSTEWTFDEVQGHFVSKTPVITNKTKKAIKHKVLYDATPEHPAQIEKWSEDVTIGNWSTKKFSGAISNPAKAVIISRVKTLEDAVRFAREQANLAEVTNQKVGGTIFNYLFGE